MPLFDTFEIFNLNKIIPYVGAPYKGLQVTYKYVCF